MFPRVKFWRVRFMEFAAKAFRLSLVQKGLRRFVGGTYYKAYFLGLCEGKTKNIICNVQYLKFI